MDPTCLADTLADTISTHLLDSGIEVGVSDATQLRTVTNQFATR